MDNRSIYRIAGNFRVIQIFVFFEGRAINPKIKTGPTHRYFTCKLVVGVVSWQ